MGVPKGTGKSRSFDRHERGVGFAFSLSLRKVPERHGRLRSDRERDVAQTTRVTFFLSNTKLEFELTVSSIHSMTARRKIVIQPRVQGVSKDTNLGAFEARGRRASGELTSSCRQVGGAAGDPGG